MVEKNLRRKVLNLSFSARRERKSNRNKSELIIYLGVQGVMSLALLTIRPGYVRDSSNGVSGLGRVAAPAWIACNSTRGGKPPFPTLS